MPKPYEFLLELAQLIGWEPAREFVRAFGGDDFRFPKTEESEKFAALAEVVGTEAARKLAKALGGTEQYIAKGDRELRAERNRALIARFDHLTTVERYSRRSAVSLLVREFHLSNRAIDKVIDQPVAAPGEAAQMVLF